MAQVSVGSAGLAQRLQLRHEVIHALAGILQRPLCQRRCIRPTPFLHPIWQHIRQANDDKGDLH